MPPHTTSSRRTLSSNPAFQNFLKSVRQNAPSTPSGPNDPMDLGSFEVARYTQREITHNPGIAYSPKITVTGVAVSANTRAQPAMPASQSGSTFDEETVNTALIAWLMSFTEKEPTVQSIWKPTRLAFKAQFGQAEYEARADGCLEVQSPGGKIQAIIEVKAARRIKVMPDVQMQESAQMVGWVMDDQNRPDLTSGPVCAVDLL